MSPITFFVMLALVIAGGIVLVSYHSAFQRLFFAGSRVDSLETLARFESS